MNSNRGFPVFEEEVEENDDLSDGEIIVIPPPPISDSITSNAILINETGEITFNDCLLMLDADRSGILALMIMYMVLIADFIDGVGNENACKVFNWSVDQVDQSNYTTFVNGMSSVVLMGSIKNIFLSLIEYPYEVIFTESDGTTLVQRPKIFKVLKRLGVLRADTKFGKVPADMSVQVYFTNKAGKLDENKFTNFLMPHFNIADFCQFAFAIPKTILSWETRFILLVNIVVAGITKKGKTLSNRKMTHKVNDSTTLLSLSLMHNTPNSENVLPEGYKWGQSDFICTILALVSDTYVIDRALVASMLPKVNMWNNHFLSDILAFSVKWSDYHIEFKDPKNGNFMLLPYARNVQKQSYFIPRFKNIEIQRFLLPKDIFSACRYLPVRTPQIMYFRDRHYTRAFVMPSIETSESIVYGMFQKQYEQYKTFHPIIIDNRNSLRDLKWCMEELMSMFEKSKLSAPLIEPDQTSTHAGALFTPDHSIEIISKLGNIQKCTAKTYLVCDAALNMEKGKPSVLFDRMNDLETNFSAKMHELTMSLEAIAINDRPATNARHKPSSDLNVLHTPGVEASDDTVSSKKRRLDDHDQTMDIQPTEDLENMDTPPPEDQIYVSDDDRSNLPVNPVPSASSALPSNTVPSTSVPSNTVPDIDMKINDDLTVQISLPVAQQLAEPLTELTQVLSTIDIEKGEKELAGNIPAPEKGECLQKTKPSKRKRSTK